MAKKKKTLKLTAMTRGGAASLIKFYRDKLGCKVVKDPYLNEDGVQWSLEITEPVWKVI